MIRWLLRWRFERRMRQVWLRTFEAAELRAREPWRTDRELWERYGR